MEGSCVFCNIFTEKIIFQNDYAFVVPDKFPQSKGHLLIIPKRHVTTYFDLTAEEKGAMLNLLDQAKIYTDDYHFPNGYNVLINAGEAAGQIVMHAHIHLIPRYGR
ncbi:MAG: HIT family protein [Ignavibacteria bacterium]|jgi:diadenosine tetraphosphate (Ap4A) HIT family hydrolase|nr:HIT family protein [Ignavibacteria bacterium]MBK6878760.1 HIT family protein [Ignavibacteria bacterium]MBK9225616.1 HIT family protein [Ignavibacteria bacterium]